MDIFKNLVVNLRAAGPAAIIGVWVICVAALGLFGSGETADKAMALLAFAGGGIMVSLALRS